jgi:lipoprotein-anchoring transpeptidase ErfK/SrfK
MVTFTGVAAVVLLATTLAGCGNVPAKDAGGSASKQPTSASSTTGGKPATSTTSAPPVSTVALTPNVDKGKKGVKVDTVVKVTAAQGTVAKVKLWTKGKDKQGESKTIKVGGTISKDGTAWTANGLLEPGSKYRLEMEGKNASDQALVKAKSTFSTQKLSLSKQTYPTIQPAKGSTVGVGMPVILTFDVPVKNRKEFEKHLSVTSTGNQVGSWRWYGNQSVHFRPKNYWKKGTKVEVKADLNGVSAGNGVYGQNSASTHFTVGRSVVTKVNLRTHYAKVYIDGKLKRTIGVSGGKKGWVSRSGTKLIMSKEYTHRMTNQMIGAAETYDLNVHYAMRVTNSGEFLHAAPWNAGNLGRANTSHGCVGMSTSNAAWLYSHVKPGDPVITTGTSRGLEQGNGWSDWDISYKQYKKGSAL